MATKKTAYQATDESSNDGCAIESTNQKKKYPIGIGERVPVFLNDWLFDKSRVSKTPAEWDNLFYILYLTKKEHDEWNKRVESVPENKITEFNIAFAKELYERSEDNDPT